MIETTPITMKDIAREFGISVSTVSRALKDSPRISLERRTAIQTYAREHNFYPNVIAESLRNSRVKPQKLIGVIIPQLTHRSEEHTSELQSRQYLVCRLLLEKKKKLITPQRSIHMNCL